jgi:purine-binding chemotaxis protein CheW
LQHLQDQATAVPSSEQARAILDARARVLSRASSETPVDDSLDVLTFAAGAERYALETKYVREVGRFRDFTPVPGAPDFIVGVTNCRGQILCVMTLGGIVGPPSTALTDLSTLIVIGVGTPECGVLADRADGIAALRTSDILPPAGLTAGREYLVGVTREAILVIDGAQLLHDSRLIVDQRETP